MEQTEDEVLRKQIENELIYCEKQPSFNEIIENVFVGNYAFALNKKMLIKNGITHILNCAIGLKNFYENDNIFKYLYLPLYDSPSQKLEKYIETSNNFIEDGSINNHKVLVHCGQGISRSSALVMMYLITKKGKIYSEARQIFREKRPCCLPNEGFRGILESKSFQLHNKL